ncbi:hypothetical protein ACFWGN_04205 [Oerskovia sp. NPDC060338]|uniref:hypothetical protein n=1 Tax=Oerskovia sp. NPDC060338 TaxID=3347100 RepID=UPI003647B32E
MSTNSAMFSDLMSIVRSAYLDPNRVDRASVAVTPGGQWLVVQVVGDPIVWNPLTRKPIMRERVILIPSRYRYLASVLPVARSARRYRIRVDPR